jgi:hypothetical protein
MIYVSSLTLLISLKRDIILNTSLPLSTRNTDEDGIDRLNSEGGYNPIFRDCNRATRKGLKNLSAEHERLKSLDRVKEIEYTPPRSHTWSPGNYSPEVVGRDRRIERYYSDEQIYTRRSFRDDYDVPEFRRRITY